MTSIQRIFFFLTPSSRVPEPLRQVVYITNILSIILAILTFILFLILTGIFTWSVTRFNILGVGVLFLSCIFLNRKYYHVGRILFCLTPVWMTMFLTLSGKFELINPRYYIDYFDSRFILLGTTILPGIVFRLKEKVKIGLCLSSTFVFLSFFDPIHTAFGLGYYQRGFNGLGYYYLNYIVITAYFVLVFGIFTLKLIIERAEETAGKLIEEKNSINDILLERNGQLQNLNVDIEARNEEMQQQQEELSAGRDKLEEAYQLINDQKDKVSIYNSQLQNLVDEKSQSLVAANEELVKHNNELMQFSYTVSHNLRGPVARLLGLSQLLNRDIEETEKSEILQFIHQSTIDLDAVLKDLNVIIDLRKGLNLIREKIEIEDEWKRVLSMLQDQIQPDFSIEADFDRAPHIYSMRAMLHSILYNLLSNAIKYRSPDRPLTVVLKSSKGLNRETILEIQDNGLGIDLAKQKDNIFKLYKRFHTHVGGKGLGLFMVKTQLEMMGGHIQVESQLNIGTTFKITFPQAADVEKQVFFENGAAQLCFDAEINTTIILWKKSITSDEYRSVFEAMLATLKTYRTPCWIADLREQGTVAEDDQAWFATTVVPEAVRIGLRRVVTIGFKDPIRRLYLERMIATSVELGVEFFVFDSPEEAREKVREFLSQKTA